MVRNGILVHMSRRFKTVDDDQALDLTVRLGDCLPPTRTPSPMVWKGKAMTSLTNSTEEAGAEGWMDRFLASRPYPRRF